VSLILADARAIPLRDGCVQCVVTSPPYWGLRDYGHEGQIGMEQTPEAYVADLANVFDEVRRVLRTDGTCWVNLGDSYQNAKGQAHGVDPKQVARRHGLRPQDVSVPGLKPKDLVGIPWMFAFEARRRGWYLRSEIIWSKPNPMCDSCEDRPTRSHENLFLLAKSRRYFYDQAAIAEPLTASSIARYQAAIDRREKYDPARHKASAERQSKHHRAPMEVLTESAAAVVERGTRNKRSVWTLPTQPYHEAHFATFPDKLVVPCILAGSRLGDIVYDPFIGSGTVGAVAERLGRRWVGTDLSYQHLAKKRTAQRGLRFEEASA